MNFLKSSIGGVGVDAYSIRCFAKMLNCDVMKTPFKYLGMPFGGYHKKEAFWDGVVERLKTR